MNREYFKKILPIIQAFADGKAIEVRMPSGAWSEDCDDLNFNSGLESYRIKPEPKLRPWKAGEVPLGAWYWEDGWGLSDEGQKKPSLIVNVEGVGFCFGTREGFNFSSYPKALQCGQYSTDGGKTWQPCGIPTTE